MPLLSLAPPPIPGYLERLEDHPRYARYRAAQTERTGLVKTGLAESRWSEDGKTLWFRPPGKWQRLDLAKDAVTEEDPPKPPEGGDKRQRPERGRQFAETFSADGTRRAFVRDRNVFVDDGKGGPARAVTSDGSVTGRIKNGEASWVYGEELGVREAMWFSPDGARLAYYRFDDSGVLDYPLALDQLKWQSSLDAEAYPKAGRPNPKVELHVFDLLAGTDVRVPTDFGDPTLAEYVYDVRWQGGDLLFHRTNRLQNRMQLVAFGAGGPRVLAEESQPQSWAENHPETRPLSDGKRFLWATERNGFKNYVLVEPGKAERPVTNLKTDAVSLVRVDEKRGLVWYLARNAPSDGMTELTQLRRVRLDGKDDRRLTDPAFEHRVSLSPDGKAFVDVAQRWDSPPETRLCDGETGRVRRTLAKPDLSGFEGMGLKKTEMFDFPAADGTTVCRGTIQFPSDFDPKRRYPVLVSVYAGPESGGVETGWRMPSPVTELGYLCVTLAGRGTLGRGKAFRDAVYGKLGVVEVDDLAAGITSLAGRPYVDPKRVGIYGTSYGGYATAMALLRHPEVFAVGCASSSVTDWRNYDTIYTERYQGLPTPDGNEKGYDAGSALKLADRLQGKLMLFFGSADNNVHPANTYQLVAALEKAGKRYDLQVGPDQGHAQMNGRTMMEYFARWLRPGE